jgi:hypothetical protein
MSAAMAYEVRLERFRAAAAPSPDPPAPPPLQFHGKWTCAETMVMAKASCIKCGGRGSRQGKVSLIPCNCVLRAIFRACYARWKYCDSQEKFMSKTTLSFSAGAKHRSLRWERKNEDYIADFCLVSKRALVNPLEYRLFRLHFLLDWDWKRCCSALKIDRGTFFHCVYRVEQKLGRVFRELRPYGLFPLDEYFAPVVRTGPRPEAPNAA